MDELKIIKEMEMLIKKAIKNDESPVAALIVENGKIISKAYNKRNKSNITTDHAEIIAITKANKKLKSWRTNKCTLYVTLEPCEMCKSVIKESRIENVIYFIERDKTKKQHDKTIFNKISPINDNILNFQNSYLNIMKKFWQNKR